MSENSELPNNMSNLQHETTNSTTTPNNDDEHDPNNSTSTEKKASILKRHAIRSIMTDKSIPEDERRRRIQSLMDGSNNTTTTTSTNQSSSTSSLFNNSMTSIGSINNNPEDTMVMSCIHYERNCNIVAPCCGKIFGCRVCHDELTPSPGHGAMDRFGIREVVCKSCHVRQERSNKCKNCDIQFGEYHCGICNLWMALSKKPFHCPDCGFCRVGGREEYTHCTECSMCINNAIYQSHTCLKDKYKNNCPICHEDMFTSRQSPQDLPCGHCIHSYCFRKLANHDYRCPICKKTVVSKERMASQWEARAQDIREQPMPEDLARVVNIMCYDCEEKSEEQPWHFLGVRCPKCQSFNTVVENIVSRN